MSKIVRIPSRLYHSLLLQGGDRLVAVFCILKSSKGNLPKYYAHTSKNGKSVSGKTLLRKHTGLSIKQLDDYIKNLEVLDVIEFESNGNVRVIGNNASKRLYGGKLVPIETSQSILKTAMHSLSVRIYSQANYQNKQMKLHR